MPTKTLRDSTMRQNLEFWLELLPKEIRQKTYITHVQLNINEEYKPHKHNSQKDSTSWIYLMGDYTGGALCFEDGTKITEKYKIHEIEGWKTHWVEPFKGTRISIVFVSKNKKYKDCNTMKSIQDISNLKV